MSIFEQTWLIFTVAVIAGLFYPGMAGALEPYLMILLIALLTLSTKDIRLSDLASRSGLRRAANLTVINYLGAGAVIIALSHFFIKESSLLKGFIVMAAVPCAISVIPFTKLLAGDVKMSTRGLILNYLASLVLTPAVIWVFYRESVDVVQLFLTVAKFIVIPLFLSRFVRMLSHRVDRYEKAALNLIFLVITYGFIGMNSSMIIENFASLRGTMLVLLLRTLALTIPAYMLLRRSGKDYAVSATLFLTYKNLGYAALLALTLFGREAALPATLGIIFDNINFIAFERLVNLIPKDGGNLPQIS